MLKYRYHQQALPTALSPRQVYVFYSCFEQAGDSAGAAVAMAYFGALPNVGRGWSGQSFAIPTRDAHGQAMPLSHIAHYVDDFKIYTANHPTFDYYVAEIDDERIANYHSVADIAPLFIEISDNVIFPLSFQPFLESAD